MNEVKWESNMKKCTSCGHMSKEKAKVKKVMHEFEEGKLHSGSKKGPQVKNPKQAIAIAISESKKVEKKKK